MIWELVKFGYISPYDLDIGAFDFIGKLSNEITVAINGIDLTGCGYRLGEYLCHISSTTSGINDRLSLFNIQ
ncbi:hypothetical protein JCM12296A_57760 [Desulfosarcina cetonica]